MIRTALPGARRLTGGLLVFVSAAAGSQVNPPPFAPGDQLAVVRALCGPVERGSGIDRMGPTPETINGFLSPDHLTLHVELLSASYEENGVAKHIIVFGGHRLEDGEIASTEAERTTIDAALLEFRNGRWAIATRGAELTETGFNGRDPVVALRTIGQGRHALEIEERLWNRGSGMTNVSIYELARAGFVELLSIATAADDCGSGERCFKFEGSLGYDEKSNPASYDLRLSLKGTYRNKAGRIVRVPVEPLVLRLAGGAYAPVSQTPAARALWEAVRSPW